MVTTTTKLRSEAKTVAYMWFLYMYMYKSFANKLAKQYIFYTTLQYSEESAATK